jgi:hypothetical protein
MSALSSFASGSISVGKSPSRRSARPVRIACSEWEMRRKGRNPKTGEEILALFKRLRDEDHTVVLITHDAEVAAHADRIYVMRDGEMHEEP